MEKFKDDIGATVQRPSKIETIANWSWFNIAFSTPGQHIDFVTRPPWNKINTGITKPFVLSDSDSDSD